MAITRIRWRRGFTLVELMVVIAIVSVLLAILLPAVRKSKAVARNVRCMANLKQLGLAMQQYATDNRGKLMPMINGLDSFWYNKVVRYIGKSGYADEADESSRDNVGLCPETQTPPDAGSVFYKPGDAFTAWTWQYDTGSYGANHWLQPDGEAYYNTTAGQIFPRDLFYKGYGRTGDPARIPVIADCRWVGGWPEENDYPPDDLTVGRIGHGRRYFMGRFALIRHLEKSINVVFVDGHTRPVPLGELWQLDWHAKWESEEPFDLP
jgi:prepilin-type N-terminal cleavage/methylation domain-containing protein/prepilin-type processing-associated H-X9-DG protein